MTITVSTSETVEALVYDKIFMKALGSIVQDMGDVGTVTVTL